MLKDTKSLEVSCYVLGAGAFGFFFRWMQLQLAYENGLPGKSVWNFFVILLIAVGAVVFYSFIRKTAQSGLGVPGNFFEALSNGGRLYGVFRWAVGLILFAGSALLFAQCEVDPNATFLRVLAVLGMLTGICFPLYLTCANKPHVTSNATLTLLSLIPVLFYGAWLLTSYKQNSINPIVWNYAIEVLTLIVNALAFFRLAGFAYGVPDGKKTMFFCMWGSMLSLLSMADNRYLGQQVMLFGTAMIFAFANWVMIANLSPVKAEEPEAAEEEPEEEIVERL